MYLIHGCFELEVTGVDRVVVQTMFRGCFRADLDDLARVKSATPHSFGH